MDGGSNEGTNESRTDGSTLVYDIYKDNFMFFHDHRLSHVFVFVTALFLTWDVSGIYLVFFLGGGYLHSRVSIYVPISCDTECGSELAKLP